MQSNPVPHQGNLQSHEQLVLIRVVHMLKSPAVSGESHFRTFRMGRCESYS